MPKKAHQAFPYRPRGQEQREPVASRAGTWIPWLLIVITCAAFAPVVTHGFGPIDDPATIAENPKLNPPSFSGDSIFWFWTHPHMGLYVPVTYTVWGLLAKATWVSVPDENGHFLDARIFHAASLLFHVLSVLAVYGILRQLLRRPWAAAAGALLFAVHPIQVEAVAWTSGLKDVMSGMFSLTAIWLYLRAKNVDGGTITDTEPPTEPRRPSSLAPQRAYWLAVLSMLLAMLCKPSAMVTPLIIAILDLGILRRSWRQVAKSLIPFLAIVLPLAIVAQLAQSASDAVYPALWQRPIIAGASISFYLGKLFVPIRFGFDYGWKPSLMLPKSWFWLLSVVPLLIASVLFARRLRWLATAGFVSVAALLPVVGVAALPLLAFFTLGDPFI